MFPGDVGDVWVMYILELILLLRHKFIAWENVWCLCGTIVISRVQTKNRLRDISRQLCHSLWICLWKMLRDFFEESFSNLRSLGKIVSLDFQRSWGGNPFYWGGGLLSQRPSHLEHQTNGGKKRVSTKFGAQKSVAFVWKFRQIKTTAPAGRVHWLSAVPHRHPWTDLERSERIRESVKVWIWSAQNRNIENTTKHRNCILYIIEIY